MADERYEEMIDRQQDPFLWARKKALKLFNELRDVLGDEGARRVFATWGNAPTQARLNEIENMGLIDRLDLEFKGNVSAFVQALAAEKYVNPTEQQVESVDRQIRRLNRKRKENPFWPQQG